MTREYNEYLVDRTSETVLFKLRLDAPLGEVENGYQKNFTVSVNLADLYDPYDESLDDSILWIAGRIVECLNANDPLLPELKSLAAYLTTRQRHDKIGQLKRKLYELKEQSEAVSRAIFDTANELAELYEGALGGGE